MKPDTPRERGMAVMMVLGITTILAGLASQFAFQSHVAMRLAEGELQHLQAEYLARSAVNFLKLEIVKEKQLKSVIQQLSKGSINPKVPLCRQFPLSTALLRGFFAVPAAGEAAAENKTDEDSGAPAEKVGSGKEIVTSFDTAAAAKFLHFTGDFSAECEDEAAKFNLNGFFGLKPDEVTIGGLNAYDRYKVTLLGFLLTPDARPLFGDDAEAPAKAAEVVRNIADWVDANDQVNQSPGAAGGSEQDAYRERDGNFRTRNGKMLTLDEAYLIAGVSDEWFTPLRKYFTVYGGAKINICTADQRVVEALLTSYAANNPRIPDITADTQELLTAAVEQVAIDCTGMNPSVAAVTQDVEAILMGGSGPSADVPIATGTGTAGAATAGGGLAELITIDTGVLRLVGTGQVPGSGGREMAVRIEAVVDTKETDPKKWKMLYWREE